MHADITDFKTENQQKTYICLVQDNYSRAIVAYQLSTERKAPFTLGNLERVKTKYLLPGSTSECMLLTDEGSENYGSVKQWIKGSDSPKINHVIAQADILFSNSMIEAANKRISELSIAERL